MTHFNQHSPGGPRGGQFTGPQARVQRGVPQGGEFTKVVKAESAVTLGKAPEPARDPLGPPYERAEPSPGESPTLTRYREEFGTSFSEKELGRMAYEFDKGPRRAAELRARDEARAAEREAERAAAAEAKTLKGRMKGLFGRS